MQSPTLQGQLEQWTLRASNNLRAATTTLGIADFSVLTRKSLALRLRFFNKSVAFVALPAPVLSKIILRLATEDAIALSQSCHHLRCLVIQTTQVWTNLDFYLPTRSLNLERTLIGRSRTAPIQLAFSALFDASPALTWTRAYCEILNNNIHRITKLTISSSSSAFVPSENHVSLLTEAHGALQWTLIAQALAKPARMLKGLMLSLDDLPAQGLSLHLFAGDAPALQFCFLQSAFLPPDSYATFSNLTTLHYHAPRVRPNSLLSIDGLAAMLVAMPKLATLCLEGHTLSSSTVSSSSDPEDGCLRNVRLLHVTGVPFNELHAFFKNAGARHFSYTPQAALWNMPPAGVTAEQLVRQCSCLVSMTVGAWHTELVDHGARGEQTTIRIACTLRNAFFVLDEPLAFANLTHLTIGEFCWPETNTMPDAPHLTTLHIVLGACVDHRISTQFYAAAGVFFSSALAWYCPSLRTLQFAYPSQPPTSDGLTCAKIAHSWGRETTCSCSQMGPLSISLQEVRRFILTGLNVGNNRLACLKLMGVEPIDPDVAAVLELLYELAEDVVITSSVDTTVSLRDNWESCHDAFLHAVLS